MLWQYCVVFIFICTVCMANVNAFEFQNLQMIHYDEKSAPQFGQIDLGPFKKIGAKYYWIPSEKTTWWDAFFTCRKHKSSLATVHSLNDLDNLSPHLLKVDRDGWYWLGGNDLYVEGSFRWMDSGESIPIGNMWSNGQPDNYKNKEHCAHLWRDGETSFRMNDVPCENRQYFICERETPKAITFVAW